MARGSKDKYTDEQKRKAEHIEESYEQKGTPKDEAEARAWATVNKQSGGGEKAGGSGKQTSHSTKEQAKFDLGKRAAQTRSGHGRDSKTSLETQSKESLMSEARSRDISGRSKMTKSELIEALKKK
ncbi:Rho termination factor N-terminal domain-containing protein [Pseudomonas abietaniphila]|uniref:Rho termination factor N-terminal domain-containing protein n=1 Tax=Pseudomonas abietaniphila TaxID=89065 RepID=UPI000780DCAF|nr:Rho termination factor N-terminal domain-containing protein [Pseudomonas abietaniphila]